MVSGARPLLAAGGDWQMTKNYHLLAANGYGSFRPASIFFVHANRLFAPRHAELE